MEQSDPQYFEEDQIGDDQFYSALDYQIQEKEELLMEHVDGSVSFMDNDGFKVVVPKRWTYDNVFTFEDEQLKEIILDVDPGACAVTKQIKRFKPLEPFIAYGKSKPVRIFFNPPDEPGPWEYDEDEKTFLKKFKEYCLQKNVPIPDYDHEILRWGHGKKFDFDSTFKAIQVKHDLMAQRLPLPISRRSLELLNRGFMYVCGRDIIYRPVFVSSLEVLIKMNNESPLDPDDVLGAILVTVFFIRKYMYYDKVIENVVQILELRDVTLWSMPFQLVKTVLSFMAAFDKGRDRSVFGLNASSTFSAIWNALSYFLDENTQQKVSFTSASVNTQLFELVEQNQVEEKYGGTARDRVEGEYWPPRLNSVNIDEKSQDTDTISTNNSPTSELESMKQEELKQQEYGEV